MIHIYMYIESLDLKISVFQYNTHMPNCDVCLHLFKGAADACMQSFWHFFHLMLPANKYGRNGVLVLMKYSQPVVCREILFKIIVMGKSGWHIQKGGLIRSVLLFVLISYAANYLAATLSQATLSQATLSQATLSQATLSQQTALSQAVLSAHSVPVVLLPQEAKETATIAANTNANFFIFLSF